MKVCVAEGPDRAKRFKQDNRYSIGKIETSDVTEGRNGQQSGGEALRDPTRKASRFSPKNKRVTRSEISVGVTAGRSGAQKEGPRPVDCLEIRLGRRVSLQPKVGPIVESRSAHGPGVYVEAERSHQVKLAVGRNARSCDRPRVLRNLRIDQCDSETRSTPTITKFRASGHAVG